MHLEAPVIIHQIRQSHCHEITTCESRKERVRKERKEEEEDEDEEVEEKDAISPQLTENRVHSVYTIEFTLKEMWQTGCKSQKPIEEHDSEYLESSDPLLLTFDRCLSHWNIIIPHQKPSCLQLLKCYNLM